MITAPVLDPTPYEDIDFDVELPDDHLLYFALAAADAWETVLASEEPDE